MDTKAIANGTLAAFDRGSYAAPDGSTVVLGDLLSACVEGTRFYDPDLLVQVREEVLAQPGIAETRFALVNETTLQASIRLSVNQAYQHIGILNFASAKNPGGGFLKGARAQEESLARSSALSMSQRACPDFYAFHRAQETCLYSDRMIYSPACPVIRDDNGNWLPQPVLVDFITSSAPNAGVVTRNEPTNRSQIVPVLVERASKVLALAAHHGCDALVLGAWGCGVFMNDPVTVASVFHQHLSLGGAFARRFRQVVFAVYDTSRGQETYQAFAKQFADLISV